MLKKLSQHRFLQLNYMTTQKTPNPNFLKFVPNGKTVMENGTMDYAGARYSLGSPLARKLFTIDGINRVFYGKDYISVGKKEDAEWNILKPEIFSLIQEHFSSNNPLFTDEPQPEVQDTKINENDSEVVISIKEIIDTRVRPIVQDDGGDIVYKEFNDTTGVAIVKIEMKGSCSGCPSSSITLKQGIEKMLCYYVPQVKL